MIQQNYPNQQPQGFGWFGGENQQQGSNNNVNNRNSEQTPFPPAPATPSLFLPNFVPPVYYPNSYPYPNYNFPNFNLYPFAPPYNPNHPNGNVNSGGHQSNGQNAGGQVGENPDVNTINRGPNPSQAITTTTQSSINVNEVESHNRLDGKDGDTFLTNAFFGEKDDGSQKVNREWTESDEMKWQATTKAPYFENKVPGLDHCTLPASAVLGEIYIKF